MNLPRKTAIVVGAGPAGLSAADELTRSGRSVTVIEQDPNWVGGLARTVDYKGFRFDLGAHRFFSKNPEIRSWWFDRLGKDFIKISRLTRILYRGRYFNYPLSLSNVIKQLGLIESARCLLSYFGSQIAPTKPEISFKDWVQNRFGTRLFQIFFKTYTEKVWGMPCEKISADWAAQRIRGLSLYRAVAGSLGFKPNNQEIKTLAEQFHYPRLGCGMMWESTRNELARSGVQFIMGQRVSRILLNGDTVSAIETINQDGQIDTSSADDYILSMPLSDLVRALEPPPPGAVRQAAELLTYRDLLIVLLIVDKPDIFPDHWIYIHDPKVSVGRIANPRNWSLDMIPDQEKTGLVLDYFCSEGDNLWNCSEEDLLHLARSELEQLGIARTGSVIDGHVVRVPRAYPILDAEYKAQTLIIRQELSRISNLHVAGRNGMHKYNNQDHSMLTGIMAARAANGESVDPWKVNIDAVYNEEEDGADSSRLLPTAIGPQIKRG